MGCQTPPRSFDECPTLDAHPHISLVCHSSIASVRTSDAPKSHTRLSTYPFMRLDIMFFFRPRMSPVGVPLPCAVPEMLTETRQSCMSAIVMPFVVVHCVYFDQN